MRAMFRLRIRPEAIGDYVEAHGAVAPEMLRQLRENGWRNYSIFLSTDGTVVGYFEADDITSAQLSMSSTRANHEWQELMAPFFSEALNDGDAPTEFLREIFNLDDQLKAIS